MSEPYLLRRIRTLAGSQPIIRIQSLLPGAVPLFVVDAVVVEEDTYRVLGADPIPRETHVPPKSLLGEATSFLPVPPGSLLVQDGAPLKFLAVVRDLNEEHTLREEWVQSALATTIMEANRRRIRSLAMETWGTRHGSLTAERFAVLFGDVIAALKPDHPIEVWLLVGPSSCVAVHDVLSRAGLTVQIEPATSGRV